MNHKKEISDNAKSAVLDVRKIELESIGQTKKKIRKKIVPKRLNATGLLTQRKNGS